jgi:hypothetical protein
MSTIATAVVAGFFFLFMLLSGLWLSRRGRPLSMGLSALHKLISLGAGIFLVVTVIQRNAAAPLVATEWIAVAVTGLCFIVTVAAGAVLSGEKSAPVAVLRIHQILPALVAISTGVTLYLLLGRA